MNETGEGIRRMDKRALERRAAGPAVVQRATALPMVGHAARRLWQQWLNWRLETESRHTNAPARAAFAAAPPRLDAVQAHVLGELEERGIATTSVAELLQDQALFDTLQRAAASWVASAAVQEQERNYTSGAVGGILKAYLVRMFGKGGTLPWSDWLLYATHSRLLDVVNSYLHLHARLNYVDVWDTVPLVREGPDIGSQRWHRDPESPRMVKVFTYLSDVDRDAGPFTYIPHSRPGDRWGDVWPQEFPRGSNPPAGELERVIPEREWHVATGRTGTVLLVDTAGFHRGGRATRDRRVMSVFNYVPPASAWPRVFDVDAATLPADLSPAARFALLS